jgi:hypothetical protein
MAWRVCDEGERLMFRGVVAQSQDTISEQAYTINYTAHDYSAMLARRFTTGPNDLVYTQWDQDDIAGNLLSYALGATAGDGTSFAPGSYLPLTRALVASDGTARGLSGIKRDRTYPGQTIIGQALTDLGACLGGYDLDVLPAADSAGVDYLRIFYNADGPGQGMPRPELMFIYGATCSNVSRSVNSADFANYCRTVGQGATTEGAPQVYADAWNADAGAGERGAVGLWMSGDNQSDVSQSTTLTEKVKGDLARSGVLMPSYTLGITPGWWRPDAPAMGDTVGLVIRKGRLDVSSTVRILGINYEILDDAAENVEVTVGRPARALTALFRDIKRDVDALARR